jgi:hypothetical protein
MEIWVRLRTSVPDNLNICWYCGLYLPWTNEGDIGKSLRQIKLWDGETMRAHFCPACTS